MGKAKKIIIGVVVTALVGTGICGGLMYVRKGSQKEVLVASVSDLAGERYDSDATLSGTVYANATQRISVEKDMIIQEVYVSKGDEVKPGDKLISFDMTLVEMELNIAKLKLQKQQQDLAAAKKRLTSLQNGGPILDSDSSSADNLIDSGKDSTEDDSSDSMGDDELSSAVTASDHYLAAVLQPMLLAAVTDGFADAQAVGNEEITSADTQEVGNEDIGSADEMTSGDTGDLSADTEADSGDDSEDDSEDSTGDPGTASGFYDEPSSDGFSSDISDTNRGGFFDGSNSGSSQNHATVGNDGFVDGEEPFYLTLDYDTEPYQGTGTEEDPYLYLCSSAKGKVNVTGAFLNKMAGYNADGTILLHPGGYWYLLEFHQNDTIADFQDRTLSCTGYYLIDGSLLENPVYMYAETEFTLDEASKYDKNDDEIPDDSGDGDDGTDGTTMSREDAIKIQKNKIASLKLDIEENNLKITKLENKVKNKLVTSKLDGTVAYIGDEATGSYNGDAFLKVKSKDGFYVTGTVGELMLDQMKEGTLLQCTSYNSGSFEAKVLNVSDYPVDSSNAYYYGGDSNPNVSYYTFNAEITDRSLQFTDQDYVTVSLKSNKLAKGSLVVMKAFIRTENGTSYVYKDVKGTLKKQQITVGSIVNSGYYAVVTSGLKSDDLLAFPYGDAVKEGAKTKEVTLDDMYNE